MRWVIEKQYQFRKVGEWLNMWNIILSKSIKDLDCGGTDLEPWDNGARSGLWSAYWFKLESDDTRGSQAKDW